MAVIGRRAPWWLTWVVAASLVYLFVGERVLASVAPARLILTGLGLVGLAAATAWRVLSFARARGSERSVEAPLCASTVGCAAAVVLWMAADQALAAHLGLPVVTAARTRALLGVLWPILLVLSLVPAVAAQWPISAARRAGEAGRRIEATRVIDAYRSGLVVALALVVCAVGSYLADKNDAVYDASYFRTARPGSATDSMVRSLPEPLQVLLFFPDDDAVGREVTGYFTALAAATGNVQVNQLDRLLRPDLAETHHVVTDGVVVLAHGGSSEPIALGIDLAAARPQLRRLDASVQKAFLKVARPPRIAYLTVGHGEMNEDDHAHAFGRLLGALNYQVKDLGLKNGLASDVPADANLVVALGPRLDFSPQEWSAVDRYLARGGALLLALEPEAGTSLAPLAARLGVRLTTTPLRDDRNHLFAAGGAADNRFVLGGSFSAHASVTSLARSGGSVAVVFVDPGSLEDVADAPAPGRHVAHVVRSFDTAFDDADKNLAFNAPAERRGARNLVSVVETEASAPGGKPMRAMVIADADVLSDTLLLHQEPDALLAHDGLQWLGGDEEYAGTTDSSTDVLRPHSRAQDAIWFYSTIFGAPMLVLGFGIMVVLRGRRTA